MDRRTDLSARDFTENYLKMELPVIVEDGTKDWTKEKLQIDIHSIYKVQFSL